MRGHPHLRRQGQALPRRSRRPVRGPGRTRPHGAAETASKQAQARLLPGVVLRPPEGRGAGRAPRPTRPPATSTRSSSPPAAVRRSRPPGSSPSSTSS
ncbi:hypothetical protein LV779_17485 [Streptomyces thinghirensis]|nr:hypothetical protein [Streptomyces thinghirensis]